MIAVSREPSPMQHREIEEYFDGSGVRLNVVADAFGPPEALHMVEQNVGVCLLGASAARSPSIVSKPLPAKTLTRKIGIYVREDNQHLALHQFVDLVFSKMAERREGSRSHDLAHRRRLRRPEVTGRD